MDNIIFTFENDKGQSIVVDGSSYAISDYDGLESSDYDITTQRLAANYGAKIANNYMLSRLISVEFDYTKYESLSIVRQQLLSFFCPFSSGTLIVEYLGVRRKIDYVVQKFKFASRNVHEPISCLLEVLCVDPFFKDLKETKTVIDLLTGSQIVTNDLLNESTNLTNTIVKITQFQVGDYIENLTNGTKIKFIKGFDNRTFLFFDGIQKKAYIKGPNEVIVKENAFDYVSLDSSYITLNPGTNNIKLYKASTTTPLYVWIYHTPIYGGI